MSTSEKKPTSTRLATAVPGALSAVLLIGAVAFGATSLRSAAEDQATEPAKAAAAEGQTKPEFSATVAGLRRDAFTHDPTPQQPKKPEAPKEEPKPEAPKEEPKPEAPKEEPKPEPTAKPKPAPVETKPAPTVKPAPANPTALVLEAWAKETKAKLSWTPFGGEGFEYYKVVRSADTHVTWPASGDDQVVGVIGDPNAPWLADKPGCGTAWNYAVFAVTHGDGGYVILAMSNVASVTTTCAPEPAPIEVKPLAFQLNAMPGQGIQLSWEACWNDRFAYYKVVRSGVHGDPRFPLNDGTELIAVIGDPNQTLFVDAAVAAGQTWAYRVVAVKDGGGTYVPLCETPAMLATAQ
jgi:hypothetical protein